MKKLLLTAFLTAFALNLANAENQTPNLSDANATEISSENNITNAEIKSNFSVDIGASLTTKDGTFIKSATGEGSGQTKEIATRNAIIEAVSQMKGMSVEKNLDYKMSVPPLGSVVGNQSMSKASKGRVDAYEVVSIKFEPTNNYYIVRVNVYKTLFKRGKKPSVTIFNASNYKNLGENLRQRLTNELVQSKKFSVLDRKNSAYYKAEKQLIESEDASSEDIYKLGNILGTDYMLVFNFRDLGSVKTQSAGVAATSTQSEIVKADVVVDYQMILFATNELKLSNSITMRLTLKDDSVKTNEEAMKQIANAIATDILNELSPIEVSSMAGDEAQFEERLEKGAIYECESKTSANSGKIKITKATSKSSVGQVISGIVSFNDVCKLENALTSGKDASYQLGTNGGVNLGW